MGEAIWRRMRRVLASAADVLDHLPLTSDDEVERWIGTEWRGDRWVLYEFERQRREGAVALDAEEAAPMEAKGRRYHRPNILRSSLERAAPCGTHSRGRSFGPGMAAAAGTRRTTAGEREREGW